MTNFEPAPQPDLNEPVVPELIDETPCLGVAQAKDEFVAPSVHWRYIFLSALVILIAFSLRVPGEEKVYLPFFEDTAIPGSCFSRETLGVDCPGCGLTRCFICMAHFDFVRAWHFNPVGVFCFLFVVVHIPYRGIQLRRHYQGKEPLRLGIASWILYFFLIALLTQWIVRSF